MLKTQRDAVDRFVHRYLELGGRSGAGTGRSATGRLRRALAGDAFEGPLVASCPWWTFLDSHVVRPQEALPLGRRKPAERFAMPLRLCVAGTSDLETGQVPACTTALAYTYPIATLQAPPWSNPERPNPHALSTPVAGLTCQLH